MVSDSQGQRKGKPDYLFYLFQITIDVVDCRIMLPPLFLRVFGGDDWKEVRGVGTGVFIYDFLQVRVPDDGFFLTCCLGCVS